MTIKDKILTPHSVDRCPYLHVNRCPGCGKICACYKNKKELNGKTSKA